MMWLKLRRMVKNQRGMTLIELIVALAITGIIMVGAVMVFEQTLTVTAASNNHLQAVRELQNAGQWINRDGQKATSVHWNPTNLTLTCQDSPAGQPYQIVYALSGTQLTRQYNGATLNVAEDITLLGISTIPHSTGYAVKMTATVGGFQPRSETLTYTFKPRPTE